MLGVLTCEALLEATWRRHGEGRGCYRRHCLACGRTFFTSRPEACYCRAACRQRAYRARLRLRREGAALERLLADSVLSPADMPGDAGQGHDSAGN